MAERGWRVRLSASAELDFANILKWTSENFGARQAEIYQRALVETIGELAEGPDVAGSRTRPDIARNLMTLHVARRGRRASHFLVYRTTARRTIEIARILHERMDLQRHIPSEPE